MRKEGFPLRGTGGYLFGLPKPALTHAWQLGRRDVPSGLKQRPQVDCCKCETVHVAIAPAVIRS
jgi:hypothetical protein